MGVYSDRISISTIADWVSVFVFIREAEHGVIVLHTRSETSSNFAVKLRIYTFTYIFYVHICTLQLWWLEHLSWGKTLLISFIISYGSFLLYYTNNGCKWYICHSIYIYYCHHINSTSAADIAMPSMTAMPITVDIWQLSDECQVWCLWRLSCGTRLDSWSIYHSD